MIIAVYSTKLSDLQVDRLRVRDRQAFDRFVDELGHRGCAALGYRLTGPVPINAICIKHLPAELRVAVSFRNRAEAWVLLVGKHLRDDPGMDIYTLLYELVGVRPPDDEKRTKPPCCDGDSGLPVELEAEIEELLDRARSLARSRR